MKEIPVKLVNITVRPLEINGITIEPEWYAARLESAPIHEFQEFDAVGTVHVKVMTGECDVIWNVPEPIEGVTYIAPMPVAARLRRPDVMSAVKDHDSGIVKCLRRHA